MTRTEFDANYAIVPQDRWDYTAHDIAQINEAIWIEIDHLPANDPDTDQVARYATEWSLRRAAKRRATLLATCFLPQ